MFGQLGIEIWLATGLCFMTFGSFTWALRRHFEPVHRLPGQMRMLSLFSFLAYVNFNAHILRDGVMEIVWVIAGLGALTASVGLFWWAIFTTKQARIRVAYSIEGPEMVLMRGPYAYVRHPFYASYIAFWLATALIAGPWQWPPAMILIFWYIKIARAEESRFRLSDLSNLYAVYRDRTGMILPRLRSAIPG